MNRGKIEDTIIELRTRCDYHSTIALSAIEELLLEVDLAKAENVKLKKRLKQEMEISDMDRASIRLSFAEWLATNAYKEAERYNREENEYE